jgi:hypothetical protein
MKMNLDPISIDKLYTIYGYRQMLRKDTAMNKTRIILK